MAADLYVLKAIRSVKQNGKITGINVGDFLAPYRTAATLNAWAPWPYCWFAVTDDLTYAQVFRSKGATTTHLNEKNRILKEEYGVDSVFTRVKVALTELPE